MVIPSFISVSRLRPDVVLYSLSTKTVIILELTCLCEENMEELHNKKCEKYHPLSLAMVSNGWSVHLLPIEVGARGYCSTNVKSCLMRLGFSSNLVKSTLKSLSLTSLKASFQIWLGRDPKKCENFVNPSHLLKAQEPQQVKKASGSHDKAKFIKSKKPSEAPQTSMNCGILNKGNTCYINTCLQSFS